MRIANVAPQTTTEPEIANQPPSNVGNQSITTASETISPTTPEKPSADAAREKLMETAIANKGNSPTLAKSPLDDPLAKSFLLDRLGCGNNPPHAPGILMENVDVDTTDEDGTDPGTDFPGEDSADVDGGTHSSSSESTNPSADLSGGTPGPTDSSPGVTHPEQQSTNASAEDAGVTHEQTSTMPDTTSDVGQISTKTDSNQTSSNELGVCTENGDFPADPRKSLTMDPVQLYGTSQLPAESPQLGATDPVTMQEDAQYTRETESNKSLVEKLLDFTDELRNHPEGKEFHHEPLPPQTTTEIVP